MAQTVIQLQAQRDLLLRQLSEPLSVTMRDRSQVNRSAADIQKAISKLDVEIEAVTAASASRKRVRQYRIVTTGGF